MAMLLRISSVFVLRLYRGKKIKLQRHFINYDRREYFVSLETLKPSFVFLFLPTGR